MALPDLINKYLNTQVNSPFARGLGYRTFKELNIAAAGSYVIRVVVPKNVVLTGLDVSITSGTLKTETVVGGTAGGAFAENLPRLSTNTRTDITATPASVVLTAGGTHTGGTVIDIITLKAGSNAARSTSVGGGSNGERGIGPNTYYWRFTSSGTDPVVGTFKARWNEV